MAHTPGPWKVVHPRNCNDDTFHPCIHANAKGFGEYHIAQTFLISPGEMEDNARLIAAAPELKAALEAMIEAALNDNRGLAKAIPLAIAAIVKAERG